MHKSVSENAGQDLPEGYFQQCDDGASSHRSENDQELHTGRVPKLDDDDKNAIRVKQS